MTTPAQQMKDLILAVGKCWHEHDGENVDECIKCGYAFQREDYEPYDCSENNPSPTDLNELFRIAEKLDCGFDFRFSPTTLPRFKYKCWWYISGERFEFYGNTPADSLREALWQAVKGENK